MNTSTTTSQAHITVATAEGLYFFNAADIIRMEASSNYTYIYFTNRKPLLISRILGEYEEQLSSMGFIRTHRSHLVNKQHIVFIDGQGQIIMQDESKAEISRRKKKEVMKALRAVFTTQQLAA